MNMIFAPKKYDALHLIVKPLNLLLFLHYEFLGLFRQTLLLDIYFKENQLTVMLIRKRLQLIEISTSTSQYVLEG